MNRQKDSDDYNRNKSIFSTSGIGKLICPDESKAACLEELKSYSPKGFSSPDEFDCDLAFRLFCSAKIRGINIKYEKKKLENDVQQKHKEIQTYK